MLQDKHQLFPERRWIGLLDLEILRAVPREEVAHGGGDSGDNLILQFNARFEIESIQVQLIALSISVPSDIPNV